MKLSSPHKLFLLTIACLCFASGAQAQVVVTQTQAMSFGTFAFVSFNSVLSVTIQADGSASPSNATMIVGTSRGEFDLDAGIANANSFYTVTTPTDVPLTGPGGNFTIDNFVVQPATLRTDATGFDQFTLSARLRSLGDGTEYGNGLYNQDFNIIIAF